MNTNIDNDYELPFVGSTREDQVLAMAAQGYTDKQMATRLGISRETVATYWRRILQRFNASSRTEVVATVLQQHARGLTQENQRLLFEIAERRRSEQQTSAVVSRLEALIGSLKTGILFEDENHTILYSNSGISKLFEIAVEPHAFVGMNILDAFSAQKHIFEDHDLFERQVRSIVDKRRAVHGDRVRLADGRVLERDYIPVGGPDGSGGHLWQYTDVTQALHDSEQQGNAQKFIELIGATAPKLIAATPEQLSALVDELMFLTAGFLKAQRALVYEFSADGATFSATHEWNGVGVTAARNDLQGLSSAEFSWLVNTLDKGQILAVGDIHTLPESAARARDLFEAQSTQAIVVLPLKRDKSLVGAISFGLSLGREWDDSTTMMLKVVSDMVGSALARS
ncbi:MAG: LuxR C-terminal-related transcriptional regulator [Fimbriimonas sp.]